MSQEKDVIISVFASSPQASTSSWANKHFDDPPIVLNLSAPSQFRNLIQTWSKTRDLFQAALRAHGYQNVTVRRRGLVTFSAGWAAMDELLKIPSESDKLQALILLDGGHTDILEPWISWAQKAIELDKFCILAHSEIQPPFISSQEHNTKIFQNAAKSSEKNKSAPWVETILPEYLQPNQKLPQKITISLPGAPGLPAVSKSWDIDPLVEVENLGNLTRCHFAGNDRPDHVYIAWYGQERFWRYLGEEWSR